MDMSMPPAQGLTPLNVSTSELTKEQYEETTKGATTRGYSSTTNATTAIIDKQMMTTTDVTKVTSNHLVRIIYLLYIKHTCT